MPTIKEIVKQPERLAPGHRLCAGCGAPIAVRQILHATTDKVVVGCATGCLEVTTTTYPFTAWKVPFIHNAFENSAATVSGVEAAYRSLKKQGKLPADKKIKFLAMGGDGGTYDIGFQSLSGAMERGHNMVYVCYDNGAYMNTGIQRSSATPKGASTTTSPAGTVQQGKKEFPKNMTACMIAHDIPYVAQASIHNYMDAIKKFEKAFLVEGPAFVNILAPCPRGWRYPGEKTVEMARLAVESCFWALFEVENGKYRLTGESARLAKNPDKIRPVMDWMQEQGRFRHLKLPKNADLVVEIQEEVKRRWQWLLKLVEASNS